MKRFGQQEIDNILEEKNNGATNKEVAKIFDRSESSIEKLLKRVGFKSNAYMSDDEKKNIINLWEDGLNTVQISEITKRSQTGIERFLKKEGYTDFGKDSVNDEDIKLIHDLYINNKMNAKEVWEHSFKDRFCEQYIERIVKREGFSRGMGRGGYNKFLKHNYFDNIDNPNKAYILGYIFADGGITDNKTLRLECVYSDIELLEFIKSELNSNLDIHRYSREGRNDTVVLYIHSTDIVNSLSKYGIVKGKQAMDIMIPNIDNELMPDFIRGYFDGDGSITHGGHNAPRVSICTTETFGRNMLGCLEFNGIMENLVKSNLVDMSKYNDNIYNVRIHRKQEVINFFNYIYTKNCFKLQRKYDKFIRLIYANTEITENQSVS